MTRRESARAEAAFMRGDVGVDGAATEEERDEAELEKDKAREGLLRGKTFLGREFLTWLLWQSESGDPVMKFGEEEVVALFTGKVTLRGIHGDVHELSARGALAPYSLEVKHGLARGLLVHNARIRLTAGERSWEATLDAEFLDVRSAKLPALLSEEEDDKVTERLFLTDHLSQMLDGLLEAFLAVRTKRSWGKQVVPALKAWMREAGKAAA